MADRIILFYWRYHSVSEDDDFGSVEDAMRRAYFMVDEMEGVPVLIVEEHDDGTHTFHDKAAIDAWMAQQRKREEAERKPEPAVTWPPCRHSDACLKLGTAAERARKALLESPTTEAYRAMRAAQRAYIVLFREEERAHHERKRVVP